MSDQPRYQTLRDYMSVVRAQRWLILLFVVVFGGAAFAYSARQDPVYEAEASLAFKDLTEDLRFLGFAPASVGTPQQRSAVSAQLVTRPEVAERVKEELGLNASIEAIQSSVSARSEAQTFLVVIDATAGSAQLAASLANEFARQTRAVVAQEDEKRLTQAVKSLEEALEEVSDSGDVNDRALRTALTERITRVEALRSFGETVDLARLADVPSSRVSPNPVRNTSLGVILGLALGLLLAFIRDSLDVRLRGSREIQAQVKLPLVGHIGSGAMGSTALAASNGHRKLSPEDLEGFRILRKNLEFLDIDNPVRTVAVTSALPEEGKSTVAAALASTYALAGRAVLLVECDLRRPSLAERLGINRAPGLTDYLAERAGPAEVLQGIPVGAADAAGQPTQELVCITAGSQAPRPAEILGSKRFADFIREVSEAYDMVVLDTSPLLPVSDTLELLPHVDGIVLCIRAGQTRRDEARAAKAALEHLPERPTGLVVTGIKPGDEADYGYYSASYAYRSAPGA